MKGPFHKQKGCKRAPFTNKRAAKGPLSQLESYFLLILSCFELFISDIVIKDCFYLHYISSLKGTYSVYSQNFKICYSFISQFHKGAQFATSLFHNFKRNRALYFTISRTNRALISQFGRDRVSSQFGEKKP